MKKIIAICIIIVIAAVLYSLTEWYESENMVIENSNQKYKSDTKKLQEIAVINKWLKKNVKKHLYSLPDNAKEADLKLIKFFDRYAREYDFIVEKYIYKDKYAHLMDVKYSISREKQKILLKFLQQEYPGGFFFLKSLQVDGNALNGELVVIQPFIDKKQPVLQIKDADVPQ